MPLDVATWMADPRIRTLTAAQRAVLIDAFCQSWMDRAQLKRVPKAVRAAYELYWPGYDEMRVKCEKAYARKVKRYGRYNKLLADPRWLARREQILKRDGWACTRCSTPARRGNALQVHHLRYKRGEKPWESSDDALATLCQSCHSATHGRRVGR